MDPTLTSRCTHLLCESQVSNMYAQVSKLVTRIDACFHSVTGKVGLFSVYFMLTLSIKLKFFGVLKICALWYNKLL